MRVRFPFADNNWGKYGMCKHWRVKEACSKCEDEMVLTVLMGVALGLITIAIACVAG